MNISHLKEISLVNEITSFNFFMTLSVQVHRWDWGVDEVKF